MGKTESSLLLAGALKSEIISADSMQVYKYMDIGTAKPSLDKLRAVPHHMIDVALPSEEFSAGRFVSEASPIVNTLCARVKHPVIAGGTGLYIRALSEGLFEGPAADWKLRQQLESDEVNCEGFLYNLLCQLDPVTASKVTRGDTRRIIRALEVILKLGVPMSEAQKNTTPSVDCDFVKICLTRERTELYRMIEDRVDVMVHDGLFEEARELFDMPLSKTTSRAIGYREAFSHFRGEVTFDEAVLNIKQATRRYAKRQMTWFRAERDINWIDITGIFDPPKIYDKIISLIGTN
ncbi:tRNA (adenosine(37)-N6)-dimethylallyltransferase MiaA [Candidatus Magnetomonas plexicatena]|nr:tRNA (adenosine(37)-N6)-dimethylallyltransferase MiaA [Nitrospirales bacterium LBB_01]